MKSILLFILISLGIFCYAQDRRITISHNNKNLYLDDKLTTAIKLLGQPNDYGFYEKDEWSDQLESFNWEGIKIVTQNPDKTTYFEDLSIDYIEIRSPDFIVNGKFLVGENISKLQGLTFNNTTEELQEDDYVKKNYYEIDFENNDTNSLIHNYDIENFLVHHYYFVTIITNAETDIIESIEIGSTANK